MRLLRISPRLLRQVRHSTGGNESISAATEPLHCAHTGLFGNLLLRSPRGFELLTRVVSARSSELVGEIVQKADERAADRGMRTTVSLVDDLSNEICSAADLTDCARCMHTDPEWGRAAEEAMRFFTSLVETLNTTPALYKALKESLQREQLDPVSERTAKLLLEEFEQSGIQLADQERQMFVKLSDEIFGAGTNFVIGCERSVPLTDEERKQFGLSENTLDGPWVQHMDWRLRRFTYTKYFGHSDQQESFLRRLISARHDLALLTNFQSFAHRAQNNSVLGTYENVHSFLDNTIKEFFPKIHSELAEVNQIVRNCSLNFDPTNNSALNECDVEFATALKRHSILHPPGLSSPFSTFRLTSLLDGFEWLVNALYGLRFEKQAPESGECWPGSVLKLDVYRTSDNVFLGSIFLDVDARSSKLQGDCHFTVRCSKLLDDGTYQTPIVVLSLAFVPSSNLDLSKPSLAIFEKATMNVQQAENFFHEMGHAMHSILGRTRFQHVAGTRCSTDFAEVPSHLMECFFNDKRILKYLCRDESGRLPTDEKSEQLEAILNSRRVFGTLHTLRQALYALFDLEIHGEHAADIAEGRVTTTELFRNLHQKALPQLEHSSDYAYHHRISHLVTYGAKYYSYLVARASASLIYERLFAADPLCNQNGLKWANVQSHGGEYPSDVLLGMALDNGDHTPPSSRELIAALALMT